MEGECLETKSMEEAPQIEVDQKAEKKARISGWNIIFKHQSASTYLLKSS